MLTTRIGLVPLQWMAYLYAIPLTAIAPQDFADFTAFFSPKHSGKRI